MKLGRVNISYFQDKSSQTKCEGAINYTDKAGRMLHVHFYDDLAVKTNGVIDWSKVKQFLANKGITIK